MPFSFLFRRLICVVLFIASLSAATAGEELLGPKLAYVRVKSVTADLPSNDAPLTASVVVDLRFVKANNSDAAAFTGWLKGHAKTSTPVIVLVNNETSPALLTALAAQAPAGVISIGPAVGMFKPDIAMKLDEGADKTAYEAFEKGTPLQALITPKLDKPRRDEAASAKDRIPSRLVEEEDENVAGAAPTSTSTHSSKESTTTPAPVVPIDSVLLRAVQFHHALVALRKI